MLPLASRENKVEKIVSYLLKTFYEVWGVLVFGNNFFTPIQTAYII